MPKSFSLAAAIESCFELLTPTGSDNEVPLRHLIVRTCKHGSCYSGQLVCSLRIEIPHLTELDSDLAIGKIQVGVLQNLVSCTPAN